MMKAILVGVCLVLGGCGGAAAQLKEKAMTQQQILLTASRDSYVAQCGETPNSDYCVRFRDTLVVWKKAYDEFNATLEKQ
jgi:hypothetical protein